MSVPFSEDLWQRLSGLWRRDKKEEEEAVGYDDPQLKHLTSSMRTPKPIIKQWCDPLMTFHKHCSCYSLLTLR